MHPYQEYRYITGLGSEIHMMYRQREWDSRQKAKVNLTHKNLWSLSDVTGKLQKRKPLSYITVVISKRLITITCNVPITRLGRSMISLRIEKQNVHGTGAPEGFRSTQWEYTDCVVFSNA